ncbi:CPBP family intramembrane glutamic endopeptidase [Psychroflexus sp. MES1-P1E]|uniref:CPBP family intramembrane glutamic endopeptidase n=1 Tax=Psychroflexus sp. MES1-P1E TaxID=2058320 RepID=UPI000C7A02B8|nr:CPBP family intramembrane glutamic endopeptidase [Psychroflexus sp. MES1-P1E]PKG43856.1 CPBP family intramembrane metalloprotease [Psychroflexus sp. MES1-P1E]
MKNKHIYRILIFYLFAIIISNIFRFDIFDLNLKTSGLQPSVSILLRVFLEGIGVLIGALIAIKLMKQVKTSSMSLFGTSITKSIILFVLPIVVLTVIGVNNKLQLNSNIYGFIAGLGTIIYCILEEYGWRGYLQDELSELKSWKRYLIIGFLWYLWHLSFLSNTNVIDNLIFLAMLILGSWGIGQIAIATKSIIACAAFHFLVNIFTVNQLIKNGFEGNSRWFAIGIILTIAIIITKKWTKPEANINH